jgi:hypothetical protein
MLSGHFAAARVHLLAELEMMVAEWTFPCLSYEHRAFVEEPEMARQDAATQSTLTDWSRSSNAYLEGSLEERILYPAIESTRVPRHPVLLPVSRYPGRPQGTKVWDLYAADYLG